MKLLETFEHEHEMRMFDSLVDALRPHFGNGSTAYLFGNVMCNGRELDGLLLKSNGVCVIELKAYSGQIFFSENATWFAGDQVVRGGNQQNPFRQVRYNKFGLLDFLNRHTQGRIPEQNWGQISGSVIFEPTIQFDSRDLPATISPWFHICDLSSAGMILKGIHAPGIRLDDSHLRTLASFFGAALPTPAPTAPAGRSWLRVHYHKESGFRQALQEMRSRGGPAQIAANNFLGFSQILRNGGDPFAAIDSIERPEIPNLRLYRLQSGYFLAAVRNNDVIHLCTVGDAAAVDGWIEANRGLTFTLDVDGRITPSYVGNPRDGVPSNLTTHCEPFLSQVNGLDLEGYCLPTLIRRMLQEVNAETPEEERTQILETVPDPELRNCLSDVFGLVRTGDVAAAQARINLLNGVAIPEEDQAGGQSPCIDPEVNSENLVDLVGLSIEEWEKLLDPTRFQDWMLFLHPDQKRLVEEDFEKPAILTGVSGSGKTCVLVHRAKRLAGLYPDSKIGILTLNRSLAKLIENLVGELCPRTIRSRIEVLAFYDYFKQLVEHFGPELELENLKALASELLSREHMEPVLDKLSPRRLNRQFVQYRERPRNDIWETERDHLLKAIGGVDPANYARLFDPKSGETLDDTWNLFLEQKHVSELLQLFATHLFKYDGYVSPGHYLREELSLVRSAASTATRITDYLELPRNGRAIRFDEPVKRIVLALLLMYEETMLTGGVLDELGLTLSLLPHLKDLSTIPQRLKFRCLLVDEYQDMSTRDLALLRRVIPIGATNALFLTGDTVQRVMVKSFEPTKAGLGPHDTARRSISKNYRNSRQILLAASNLSEVYGKQAEDLGEQIDYLDPELAVRETAWPLAIETTSESQIQEAWAFAKECLETSNRKAWSVCIVTACEQTYSIERILAERPDDFPVKASRLTGDYTRQQDTMTVGTMADVKGFEFSMVIVVGCEAATLPNPGVPRDEAWRDALRLYVAMTRARDDVKLLYAGEPSEILITMNDHLYWQELDV